MCIILIVVGVGTTYCFIQTNKFFKELKRNSDVFSYRIDLIYRCSPDVDLLEKIVHKYTYEEMLQSSKPLEDKYWFTPDEIREINDNYISYLMRGRITKRLKDSDF